MQHWRTTVLGILTILGSVGGGLIAWLKTGQIPDLGPVIAGVTGGIGLIHAGDAAASPSTTPPTK